MPRASIFPLITAALFLACGSLPGLPGQSGDGTGSSAGPTGDDSADSGHATETSGLDSSGDSDDATATGASACHGPPLFAATLAWSQTDDVPEGRALGLDADGFIYTTHSCLSRWEEPGTSVWQVTNSPIHCAGMAVDAEGNAVLVGYHINESSVHDAEIARYDANGNERWQLLLSEEPGDTDEYALDVAIDPTGAIVVIGRVAQRGGGSALWMSKRDPDGVVQWTEHLDRNGGGAQVGVDDRGQIVLATNDYDATTDSDFILVQAFDPAGEPVWAWQSPLSPEGGQRLAALAVAGSGQVAIASGVHPLDERVLTQLSPEGEHQWSYSDARVEFIEDIRTLAFGPCGELAMGGAGHPGDPTYGQLWLAVVGADGEYRGSAYVETPLRDGLNRFDGLAFDPQGRLYATGTYALEEVLKGDIVFTETTGWIGRFDP